MNPVIDSLKTTLRLLARRWNALHDELRELDKQLMRLTKLAAPRLLACFGVGPQTAATLLVTAGDNPTRLRNEAALAALCGVSPLEASSGKNGLYKAEVIHRRTWKTREVVELATLTWVAWFNNLRLMGPLGYIPPAEAEANYYRQLAEKSAATA